MIKTPFRFLHAADLALDLPIEGVADDTDLIEQHLLSAPMEAARRLFNQAKAEDVDFVILSGNIVDANASGVGPLVFLVEQFESLDEAGIPVYWAGGDRDGPDHWPAAIHLPENVHFFRSGSLEEYILYQESSPSNIPIVRLIGMSRGSNRRVLPASDFTPDPSGLFTIAVASGAIELPAVQYRNIPYWALGGASRKTYNFKPQQQTEKKKVPKELARKSKNVNYTLETEAPTGADVEVPTVVHYPGPTLGRSPRESKDYGGTLVDVDVNGFATLTMLSTAPLHWVTERIELEYGASVNQLRSEMHKRIHKYRSVKNRDALMISWFVDCPGGTLPSDLRTGDLGNHLLHELRTDFGLDPPICWSVSITTRLPELVTTGAYNQKTTLADFLERVRQYQKHPYEPINLVPFLPRNFKTLPFGDRLSLSLPADIASESVLKRLLFKDPKKELTPVEQVQLKNLLEKIRDEQRLERLRTQKPGAKKKAKKTVASTKRKQLVKKRVFRQLKKRENLVLSILREVAALGWDTLGNEADRKAIFGNKKDE